MSLIVDASVAIKWYAQEPGSDQAVLYLSRDDLVAPDLILAEVGNAFRKRIRRGVSIRAQAEAALKRLAVDIPSLVPLPALCDAALALAIETDHPIYDCFYIALALREDAPIVTADARLAALCEAASLRVEFIGG